VRLARGADDLVRQVDGRDVQAAPGEVDADGLAGVGVEGQRLGGSAAAARRFLRGRGDHGAARDQLGEDVVQGRPGQPAALAQLAPAEGAVLAQQAEHELFVPAPQLRQRATGWCHAESLPRRPVFRQ
jgi:hypothetical protein